jgi:hypothetical protein
LRPVSPSDNPHSITIATSSGLGNSITSSWEPDNLVDSILNYRSPPEEPEIDTHFTSFLSNSFTRGSGIGSGIGSMGQSIDLFREKDETDSDSDFDPDDFDS